MGGLEVAKESEYERRVAAEKKKYHGFEKYEAEEFARNLERAAEVLSDPKKMKAASSFIEDKKKSFKTLEALKKYASKVED